MKLIKIIKGKEVPFRLQNKKELEQYISVCEELWGCVPCDVSWAMGTNSYKKIKEKMRV